MSDKFTPTLSWEVIDHGIERAWTFGGWLIKSTEDVHHVDSGWGYDWRVSLTFVPDPDRKWIIPTNETA